MGDKSVRDILNRVLNAGKDALRVDLDNVTISTEGAEFHMEVNTNKETDSMATWFNTAKDGSGTDLQPVVDADGHVQVDVLSLPVSITEYDEDSGHNSGDKGIQLLAVRNDNNTSLADTDLDYAPIGVNSTGGVIGAGYDETENFTWFKEKNPISQHHQTSELAAATGQGDTAGTYYDADMDDYKNFSLHIQNTSGATGSNVYTVEASLDGTNYIDVTSDWFGVANVTDSDAWLEMNTVCVAESVRVKVVRSGDGGSTDGAWTINLKRLY